ncbi:hypothetical protein Tsubulata_026579 [Turnera subulata]|uniref:RING-type domain-containing protein n=1 Tax=Turnera subulata TaxID=218843 RepID=A0A9Q0FZX0_9ROSI|nr:hypothetical protein Tsubulata_026579 [Turnera subulata]
MQANICRFHCNIMNLKEEFSITRGSQVTMGPTLHSSDKCTVPRADFDMRSSKPELTSKSPGVEPRRSKRVRIPSVKAREAQELQPSCQKSKNSADVVKNSKSKSNVKANRRKGNQSPSAPKQIWRAVEKKEPSKDSNPSPVTNPTSSQLQQDQIAGENECSAGAVKKRRKRGGTAKKRGNLTPPEPKQSLNVKKNNDPAKDVSKLRSTKKSSGEVQQDQSAKKSKCTVQTIKKRSNQNQAVELTESLSPRNPELSSRVKEKTGPVVGSSKPSSKRNSSGQVQQLPQKEKSSAQAIKKRETSSVPGKRQPVSVKNKTEPSKISSKSPSTQVKEKTGTTSNDLSAVPPQTISSPQIKRRKPARKNKDTAETVKQSGQQKQVVKNWKTQSSPASNQVLQERKETETSNGSCKATTSKVWQVKEKTETSQIASNISGEINSSERVQQGEPVLNKKRSGKAVKRKDQIQRVQKSKNQKQVSGDKGKNYSKGKSSSSPKVHGSTTKTKAETSKASAKRSRRRKQKRAAVQDHIKCHDFTVGESCLLCEKDLAHKSAPTELELHLDQELDKYPDVAVLPCCHAFHVQCLEMLMSEEQLKDPPCLICASLQ